MKNLIIKIVLVSILCFLGFVLTMNAMAEEPKRFDYSGSEYPPVINQPHLQPYWEQSMVGFVDKFSKAGFCGKNAVWGNRVDGLIFLGCQNPETKDSVPFPDPVMVTDVLFSGTWFDLDIKFDIQNEAPGIFTLWTVEIDLNEEEDQYEVEQKEEQKLSFI